MDMWMDVDAALLEVPVNLMPLLDDSDFKTRKTAVAYNEAGMDLVWNFVTTAGAFTQTAVTPTTAGTYDWTHQGDGMYSIEIPATGGASINNDTEGFGWFSGVATGVLPWRGPVIGFRAAALNNALIDGGDVLDVSVTEWTGTAVATPSVAGVPEVDLTHVAGATTNVAALATNVDAILTDTSTTLQGELDGIQADTEDIQTRLPAALVSGRMDSSVGAMAANVMTAAAAAADLTTELQSGLATAAALQTVDDEIAVIDGNVDTLLARITSSLFTGITSLAEWLGLIAGKQTGNSTARTELRATGAGSGTFDETTDSQEALRDRGDAAWTTATGFSTHSAADVWAAGTRVLTAATNISGPIADQVWEEAIADHSGTAGSTAEQLSAAGSAGDPWATALPGAYTSGQAGKIVGDNINATVSSRATPAQVATELGTYDAPTKAELDAAVAPLATASSLSSLVTTVGAAGAGLTEAGGTGDHLTAINLPDQTMNITGDITGNVSGSVGSVTGAVGSVTGAVGSVTGNVGGNVTGSVGSLATQAKADVNTEVVDALATDVIADSVPADGSRPTIAQALYMLTQFMTERSVSSTTMTVRKADGSTTLMTFTLDDASAPTSITRAS